MVQGDKFRVYGYYRNQAGSLADPSGSVFIRDKRGSSGTPTTYTFGGGIVLKEGTGTYYIDVDSTPFYGDYIYSWGSTGDLQTRQPKQSLNVEKAEP
jgi:hypothetical protein